MIHNEQIIIKIDESNSIKSATVFPIEYLDPEKTAARNLPPIDLASSELRTLIDGLQAATITERDALATEVASLKTQLAGLKEQLPYNPRMIDPSAWYARLSMDNVLAITEAATVDPIANSFVVALKESRQFRRDDPTYQMSLDHPNAQAGIAYLSGRTIPIDANGNTATIAKPVFTAEEAVAMLADSRADEQ